MTYDKRQKFQVTINKKYNPPVNKYVTINQSYYIGGEFDLFSGRGLKEIQFMLLCISLADQQIIIERETTKNNDFMPEYIHMTIKQEVLGLFLGNHPKRNIDLLLQTEIYSGAISEYFWVVYDEHEKEFSVMVDTKIFKHTKEKRFTQVFIWDIIKTKSLPAIYLKMKIFNFLNLSSYFDGTDKNIYENRFVDIYISKQKFKEWCQCGKTISKYLNNAFLSINKENSEKIKWVKEEDNVRNTININLDRLEYANHILKQKIDKGSR